MYNIIEAMVEELEKLYGKETELTIKAREILNDKNKPEEMGNLYQSLCAIRQTLDYFGIDMNIEITNKDGIKRNINALEIITKYIVDYINEGWE